MALADLFPRLSAHALFRPRYQRRPRIKVDRRAREALSRERRWRNRRSRPGWTILLGLTGGASIVAGAFVAQGALWPDAARQVPDKAFPDYVAKVNAAFPEALPDFTLVEGTTLSTGATVPAIVELVLPHNMLTSAASSDDPFIRLAAPFIGKERTITAQAMGERVSRLAAMALPDGVSRCYTHSTGQPRTLRTGPGGKVQAVTLTVMFNPEC